MLWFCNCVILKVNMILKTSDLFTFHNNANNSQRLTQSSNQNKERFRSAGENCHSPVFHPDWYESKYLSRFSRPQWQEHNCELMSKATVTILHHPYLFFCTNKIQWFSKLELNFPSNTVNNSHYKWNLPPASLLNICVFRWITLRVQWMQLNKDRFKYLNVQCCCCTWLWMQMLEAGKSLNFLSSRSAAEFSYHWEKSQSVRFNFQFSSLGPSKFNLMALPPLW